MYRFTVRHLGLYPSFTFSLPGEMGVQHVGHHGGHGQCRGTPRPPDQQHRPWGLPEAPQGLKRRLTGKMV